MNRISMTIMAIISSMCIFMISGCGSDDKEPVPANTAKKPNGASCTSAAECKSNYCTPDGMCNEISNQKKLNGMACTSFADCLSNYCNPAGICDNLSAPKANGQNCTTATDCISNYCNP